MKQIKLNILDYLFLMIWFVISIFRFLIATPFALIAYLLAICALPLVFVYEFFWDDYFDRPNAIFKPVKQWKILRKNYTSGNFNKITGRKIKR